MRIAHITATFPPYWGGTGNVAYYNAIELARRGHEVHVFTAKIQQNDDWESNEIFIHRLWTPIRLGNAPFTPGILVELAKFDLVHLHWPYIFGAELTWMSIRRSSIPFIITYHFDLRPDTKWIFGPYQKIWGSIIVRKARKIIAVTENHIRTSQIFPEIKQRAEDIIEIPNGVDISKFSPNISGDLVRSRYRIPLDAFVILFVGAMDKAHAYKGVDCLIDLFAKLNYPDAWLLLVGGGDLMSQYQSLASKLPERISKRIVFTSSITHNQLPDYYAACDLFVLPSRLPESFGMVLIEAMACEKPIIASDSPGVRSIVTDGETGLLFSIGDSVGLFTAVCSLYTDPKLRDRMGRNGRQIVLQKYTWELAGQKLEALYQEVLSKTS